MKIHLSNLLLLLMPFLLSSCLSTTRKNDVDDKVAAEAVVSTFFNYRKQKNEQKIHTLFSESFYIRNDSSYIRTILKENLDFYGDINAVKLLQSHTYTSSRLLIKRGVATFIYQITGTKGTWNEIYGLTLKDGVYKISSFIVPKRKASIK